MQNDAGVYKVIIHKSGDEVSLLEEDMIYLACLAIYTHFFPINISSLNAYEFHSTVLFDPFFEQCTQSEKSTKASWDLVHSQAREKGSNL